jgi:hypothetical protein
MVEFNNRDCSHQRACHSRYGHGLPAILDQHHLNTGGRLEEVVADTGYAGRTAYRTCASRGIAPTVRSHPILNRRGGFDRDRFTYEPEHDRYICPMGQLLVRIHDSVAMQQPSTAPRSAPVEAAACEPSAVSAVRRGR